MFYCITEFTAHIFSCLVTGCIPFTLTIHAPHPPSEHINFVPLSWAFVRINVFKLVSIGTMVEFTEMGNKEIDILSRLLLILVSYYNISIKTCV